ncbi:hypothetical protein [Streptomyces huiliensis]|uniref:hypothetical protein n=1 Tax=Streptomyces huiliensis TaxID=2876027 RepID=UPI001CBD23C1|nr:hypothetical protein [Streptomyces huiliensis]MBZ4323639.1 hypothetical protein [Streptomyces huiliensis]
MKQQRRGVLSGLALRAGVVGAATAIAVAGGVSTAGAATPGPDSERVLAKTEYTFHPAGQGKGQDKKAAAASRRVIRCEMVFVGANHGAPHHSGHVPGTVNVRVRVTCTQPVRLIKGKVGLFSNHGSKIKEYGSTGRAAAKGNAALVCRSGYYQGESAAKIVAPVGYNPPTANMAAKTAKVHLTRCS